MPHQDRSPATSSHIHNLSILAFPVNVKTESSGDASTFNTGTHWSDLTNPINFKSSGNDDNQSNFKAPSEPAFRHKPLIVLALSINDVQVQAMLDTGASHSIIDERFAQEAGFPIQPCNHVVSMAEKGSQTSLSSCTIALSCVLGGFSTHHTFYLMPLAESKCLVGRDLYPRLGVIISYPGNDEFQASVTLPTTSATCSVATSVEFSTNSTSTAYNDLPEPIQEMININTGLKPSQRCTHPDAVIALDTGDAKPVFRRPYRVPQTAEAQVSTIIKDWHSDGTIELAPAGCR